VIELVHVLQNLVGPIVAPKSQLGADVDHRQEIAVGTPLQTSVVVDGYPGGFAGRGVVLNIGDSFISHSDWHHQSHPRLLAFKHESHDVVLILPDWVSMARANGFQKLDQLPLTILLNTQSDELVDDYRSDLHLQQFLVVVHQSDDGVLSADVVLVAGGHGMEEVKI
jgi:hypothetical protein